MGNTNNHEVWSAVYDSIAFPAKVDAQNKDKPAMPKGYSSGYGGLNLSSAYYAKANAEPPFTTFKRRSGGTIKHCIDYIFYQEHQAKVVELLSIPDEKDV